MCLYPGSALLYGGNPPFILIDVAQRRVPTGCLAEIRTWDPPYSRQVLTNELRRTPIELRKTPIELRHTPNELRHTPMEIEWNSGLGNWLSTLEPMNWLNTLGLLAQ